MTLVTGAVTVDGQLLSPTASFTTAGVPFTSLPSKGDIGSTASAVTPPNTVIFPAGTFEMVDFQSTLLGALFFANVTGLIGAGVDKTVFQMRPKSSTKSSSVPTAPFSTNQLNLIRIDAAKVVSGFTLLGTDQGHLYGGIMFFHESGAVISDVKVVGIAGSYSAPPGETFGVNDLHGVGNTWERLEVDGKSVGAAGFGFNSSVGGNLLDCYFHDNPFSHGATNYMGTGSFVYRNTRSNRNWTGFNFEQVVSNIVIDRCDVSGNKAVANLGGPCHMVIDSNLGSSKVTISDPIFDGAQFTVCIHRTYAGSPNKQLASDITLTVAGVPRPDLLRIVTDYT